MKVTGIKVSKSAFAKQWLSKLFQHLNQYVRKFHRTCDKILKLCRKRKNKPKNPR